MGRFTGLWTHKPAITNPNNSGADCLYTAVFLWALGFKLHNQSSVTSEANCTRVTCTQTHTCTILTGGEKKWWWRWNFVWNSSNFNPLRAFPYFHIYLFALLASTPSLHIISALFIAQTAPYLIYTYTGTFVVTKLKKKRHPPIRSNVQWHMYPKVDRAVNESLHSCRSW